MGRKKIEPLYPYWDMPADIREVRRYAFIFLNRPTFHRTPTESYQLPEHYFSDGYSIPWFARWLAHKGQANKLAPGGHDYLCEYCKDGRLDIPYEEVHKIFNEMMLAPIWIKEEGCFVHIVPEDRGKMAWAVKHFGPRW